MSPLCVVLPELHRIIDARKMEKLLWLVEIVILFTSSTCHPQENTR